MSSTLQALADPSNAFIVEGTTIVGLQYSLTGDIVIPEGITAIADKAFLRQEITSVFFPSTLKIIGREAFAWSKLVKMSFAPNAQLTTIMQSAFFSCIALVSIEIPATVQYIGDSAFAHCAMCQEDHFRCIPEVIIPKGTYAYENCFAGTCIDLLRIRATVLVPYAFTGADVYRVSWETESPSIPSHLFSRCEKLCEINFAENTKIKVIEAGAFEYCSSLYSISIPEGVTCIRQRAFQYSGLQYFKAPKTLKAIGSEAFTDTPCISIDLAESELETIGDFAFKGTKITSLTIRGKIKVLSLSIITGCSQLACLRVGESVEYFFDHENKMLNALQCGRMRFDMAIIFEGTKTMCDQSILAPLIFLPKNSVMEPSMFRKRSGYTCDDKIEGMEHAYGRYPNDTISVINY